MTCFVCWFLVVSISASDCLERPISKMSSGMLNLTHSLTQLLLVKDHCHACFIPLLKLFTHVQIIHLQSICPQVTAAFHLLTYLPCV